MKNNIKSLFHIPFIIMGASMVILGLGWITVDEPWMLDRVANEERLGMSFDDLFNSELNKTLPDYLKQIYRFFGLWVSIIGIFIVSFSRKKMIKNKDIRLSLLICIGVMVYIGIVFGYILIPSSPFIYLGWILIVLHLIALYAHITFDR